MAHIGYFRHEFVERRKWFDERTYADIVALCQFLPGPASSQVGMAIGLSRAGYLGALAAWTAFTLPSAIALVLFVQPADVWQCAWLRMAARIEGCGSRCGCGRGIRYGAFPRAR